MSKSGTRVSREIFDGLKAVKESGKVDMFDYPKVAALAEKMGFKETAAWVQYAPRDIYPYGVLWGFKVKGKEEKLSGIMEDKANAEKEKPRRASKGTSKNKKAASKKKTKSGGTRKKSSRAKKSNPKSSKRKG